jgi:energy-coupling factor transporter ATP-binding protein EcfA2
VSVLKEIFNWSKSCPNWQRDALRRLVQNGTLSEKDFAELALICESAHSPLPNGVSIPVSQPLSEECLPPDVRSDQSVSLKTIDTVLNVNALVSKQPLSFGASGLTALYGDNASGKSGYARILKSACRARSRPRRVLPDVFKKAPQGVPSATIRFTVGAQDSVYTWREGENTSSPLSLVSVFDSACALFYVEEANDVAFRPFGLDLLDKLASACGRLKKQFDQERISLSTNARDFTDLAGPTDVGEVIASLTAQTSTTIVEKLATLSTQDITRLEDLKRQVAQIEAEDPAIRAKELKGRATRIENLGKRLSEIQHAMSDVAIQDFRAAHELAKSTAAAAKLACETAFTDEPLKGVGTEAWKELWQAARRYSEEEAYPDTPFPVTSEAALCVLCQQPLGHDAAKQLSRFESFVKAETQKAAAAAKKRFDSVHEDVVTQTQDLTAPDDLLAQLELTHTACATKIHSFLDSAGKRRTDILAALTTNDWLGIHSLPDGPAKEIATIVTELNTKAAAFEGAKAPEKLAELKAERDQLLARQKFGRRKTEILAEIERLKRLQTLAACQRDVDTTMISRKSTELTKSSITKTICDKFKNELNDLGLAHLRVEVVPTGSERGVMYHRVELQENSNASVQDVASEGEHRCVALAGFLAELATASHKSALVFDDPVSSLDHAWRESVARRLAFEAKERQVIVFTHDLVFLLLLLEQAKKARVPVTQAHVRRGPEGSGLCEQGPPWLAMDVKNRIGALKAQWQEAEKLYRTKGPILYEAVAKELYGRLRETWERAVEELLLNRAVMRFRRGIETQRLHQITDITKADIDIIEAAMGKCSTHLRGHDQALAINQPVPAPAELKTDIEQLENWTAQMRKRR